MFETERLRIREYRPTDEAFFLTIFNDFDFVLNASSDFIVPSHDWTLELIKKLTKLALFVVAESKETGSQVGFVNMSIMPVQNMDGLIGLGIAKEWWAKGYGTELITWLVGHSFKTMGLRRLSLCVYSSNPTAIALYERVGFKHEGRQREALWKEGSWVDMIHMAILAREYQPLTNIASTSDLGGNGSAVGHSTA